MSGTFFSRQLLITMEFCFSSTIMSIVFVSIPRVFDISVAYCTDSRPVGRLKGFVEGAQLFICEGMYGEEEKKVKARENKHMLFSEAASLALEAGVQRLWLTHFSPSLNNPEDYLENARVIFPQTELGEERKWITIEFPKEE